MSTRSADVERYYAPTSEKRIGFVIHDGPVALEFEQFVTQWKPLLHELHDHAAATEQERRICQDAMRGRMSFNALMSVVRMAARSGRLSLLKATVGGAATPYLTGVPFCADEASEMETEANAPLDLAQVIAAREQTAVRWEQVAELADQQEFASHRLSEAARRKARRAR